MKLFYFHIDPVASEVVGEVDAEPVVFAVEAGGPMRRRHDAFRDTAHLKTSKRNTWSKTTCWTFLYATCSKTTWTLKLFDHVFENRILHRPLCHRLWHRKSWTRRRVRNSRSGGRSKCSSGIASTVFGSFVYTWTGLKSIKRPHLH